MGRDILLHGVTARYKFTCSNNGLTPRSVTRFVHQQDSSKQTTATYTEAPFSARRREGMRPPLHRMTVRYKFTCSNNGPTPASPRRVEPKPATAKEASKQTTASYTEAPFSARRREGMRPLLHRMTARHPFTFTEL